MVQPLGKRVLIEAIIEEKKPSLILTKDESPQKFKVLAIGDDVKKVSVNDQILIGAYTTSEFKLNNQLHVFVNEENIIAKV